MVSLPTPTDGSRTGPVGIAWPRRIARVRLPRVDRFEVYPRAASFRWALRAVFSAPYVALVVLSAALTTPTSSENSVLLARVRGIDWGAKDVSWVRDVFPPASTLLVLPGSAIVLGVIGALIAGYLLQSLLEALAQRRCSPVVGGAVLVAVGANPVTAYLVVSDTADFIALALSGVALADTVRFVVWGSTPAGFRSGVQLMLAALTSSIAAVFVAAAAVTASLLRPRRARDRVRRSQVVVVVFPAVSAVATLTALTLLFGHDPLGFVGRRTFEGIPDRALATLDLLAGPIGLVLLFATLVAMALGVVTSRAAAVVVAPVVALGAVGASVLGLVDIGTVVLLVPVALLVAGAALLPRPRGSAQIALVLVLVIVLAAACWVVGAHSGGVLAWLHAIAPS